MSLVICSNQEKDGSSLRQGQSVYNAWSFRNPLSSTMTIPANAQVALQSCKVNVDGRVVFSRNNHKFYGYFGDKLDLDGTTAPQISDSTSYPVIATFTNEDEKGRVIELGTDDFANRIQETFRKISYHPNTKQLFECEALRNDDSVDFEGYEFTFKQNASDVNVNNRPANGGFVNFFHKENDDDALFSYTDNVFQREEGRDFFRCCGIAKAQPFSLTNGSYIVEINNGSFANVNSSGVEWQVALSRSVNQTDLDGYYVPDHNYFRHDDGLRLEQDCFVDFGIGRDVDGKLRVFHTVNDPAIEDGKGIIRKEVKYYNNTNSSFNVTDQPFDLNVSTDASEYSKVGFFSEGENIKVMMYYDDGKGNAEWRLVTEFDAGQDASTYFKPVNQACWCLHPVLCIGSDGGNASSCTMRIEEFSGLGLTDYDATELNKGGWFETLEALGTTYRCAELETRTWNNPDTNTRTYKTLNGSGGVNYQHVIIPEQSEIYKPTFGANARQLLGFNRNVVDVPNSGAGTNAVIFQSAFAPTLSSSMAIFVKLNNFGQDVVNAHNGNKSKIIAHLPRFDNTQSTGRLFFSPNEMVFIDLNNPSPIQVNEFDISFCYINEQYAQILTGQSIVALYFRQKPKELM